MDDFLFFLYILLVVLFLFDIILILASTALSNVNLARLLTQQDEHKQAVKRTLTILDTPHRLLSAEASIRLTRKVLLLAIVAVVLSITYWSTPSQYRPIQIQIQWSPFLALWVAILALMSVIITWAEVSAAQAAAQNAENWTLRLMNFVNFLEYSFAPIIRLPLSLLPEKFKFQATHTLVTEDELKSMVDASEQGGVLEQDERKMIYSIFNLGDTVVREIMVPRIDILALDVDTTITEAADLLMKSGFSRVPVYEETIDNVSGILYAKDLLKAIHQPHAAQELRSLLRTTYFIPEAKKVDDLLADMQTKHVHMAVAVDEYGGVAGLVTLEDIVEEIVGDIRDEFDEGEEVYYQELGEDDYLCSGRMDIDDVNELFNSHLSTEEADTLAGLVYHLFGRITNEVESIVADDLLLTAAHVFKRRIRKVRVQRNPKGETDANP